jgi:hypothetical protein
MYSFVRDFNKAKKPLDVIIMILRVNYIKLISLYQATLSMYNTHKMIADGKTIHIVKIGDTIHRVSGKSLESVRNDLDKVKKPEIENPKPARKES